MPTPSNPDRDETHRRRRETGDTEDRDGKEVASLLYGGITPDEHEPTQQEDGTSKR